MVKFVIFCQALAFITNYHKFIYRCKIVYTKIGAIQKCINKKREKKITNCWFSGWFIDN